MNIGHRTFEQVIQDLERELDENMEEMEDKYMELSIWEEVRKLDELREQK